MEQKAQELNLGFAKLSLTERDRRIFNLLAMLFLPVFAAMCIEAIRLGDIHKMLSNGGLVLVFASYLLGKEGLRIFAMEAGSASERALTLLTFIGLGICATGWAYRLLY